MVNDMDVNNGTHLRNADRAAYAAGIEGHEVPAGGGTAPAAKPADNIGGAAGVKPQPKAGSAANGTAGKAAAGPKRTGTDQSRTPADETAKDSSKAAGAAPDPDNNDVEAKARRAKIAAINAVIKRAEQGDYTAVPELRTALAEHPEWFKDLGNLALIIQRTWLTAIAETDLYLREMIAHDVAEMRRELERENPSPIEKLMIDRVVACRLQVHRADMLVACNQGQPAAVCKDLMERQERAHRQFADSLKQLALLQKVLKPSTRSARTKTAGTTPEAAQAAPSRGPAPSDDPLIALGQALKGKARDEQLAADKATKANGAEILPDFARFSHEGDVDALVNGVGIED